MKARESRRMNGAFVLLGALSLLTLAAMSGCRSASPTSAQNPVYSGLMSPRGMVPPAASQYSPPRPSHSATPVLPPDPEETLLPDEPRIVPEPIEAPSVPELPEDVAVPDDSEASSDLPHLENGRAVPELAGAPANRQGAAAENVSVTAGTMVYVVKSGDSLSRIAAAQKVKVADVMALNPSVTSADKIVVGQRLVMPATASGDGLEAAPARTDVPADGIYTVVAGDSLWTIGKRFGVRREDIKAWNNLTDDKLRVGQQLRLRGDAAQPAAGSKSAAPAATAETPEATSGAPAAANPAAPEPPVDLEVVPAPTNSGKTFSYYVMQGDTLEKIAQRNMTTVEAILANNPGIKSNADLVPNVTKLNIPRRNASGQ